jgi:hypothetical protein
MFLCAAANVATRLRFMTSPPLLLVNTQADGKPGASHTPAVVRSARSRLLPVLTLLRVFVGVWLLPINT